MKDAARKMKIGNKSIRLDSEENETDRSGEIRIAPPSDRR